MRKRILRFRVPRIMIANRVTGREKKDDSFDKAEQGAFPVDRHAN